MIGIEQRAVAEYRGGRTDIGGIDLVDQVLERVGRTERDRRDRGAVDGLGRIAIDGGGCGVPSRCKSAAVVLFPSVTFSVPVPPAVS